MPSDLSRDPTENDCSTEHPGCVDSSRSTRSVLTDCSQTKLFPIPEGNEKVQQHCSEKTSSPQSSPTMSLSEEETLMSLSEEETLMSLSEEESLQQSQHLPSLEHTSDNSSISLSSVDSSLMGSEASLHSAPAARSPKTDLVRSSSLPGGMLLKNDLHVPPISKHYERKRNDRKKKRERKTAAGAVGGMVVGGLALGPIGVVAGAALGGYTVRQVAKKAAKRSQRRREQQAFRDYAVAKSIQWTLNDNAAVFT